MVRSGARPFLRSYLSCVLTLVRLCFGHDGALPDTAGMALYDGENLSNNHNITPARSDLPITAAAV